MLEHVRRRAYLLNNDLLLAKSLAHMALDTANAPQDEEAYAEWERGRIDDAITDHLELDDSLFEAGRIPLDADADPRCAFVEEFARLEPSLGLLVAVLFNSLPKPNRRAFIELFIHNSSAEQCLAAGIAQSPEDLRKLVVEAMIVFRPEDLYPDGSGEAQQGVDE